MKITFVLPGISVAPSGGFKIVYEYANRLSARGHLITILYDCSKIGHKRHIPALLYPLAKRIAVEIKKKNNPCWFSLSKNVKQIYVLTHEEKHIPNADAVIATAYETADFVANMSSEKGRKYYFIQGYECWEDKTPEMIHASYRLQLKPIVISSWLKKIVDRERNDSDCVIIPNGLDFDVFGIDNDIRLRNNASAAMLYHTAEHKGTRYGLEALQLVREKMPKLKCVMFGIPHRPDNLPEWVEYVQNADSVQLRRIYNQAAFFVCPTINEGFGLTGAESMACGCALVSADYQGVHEYADEETALLSPVKDAKALAENILMLINNSEKRIALAQKGNTAIRKLDWNKSVQKFEQVIQ